MLLRNAILAPILVVAGAAAAQNPPADQAQPAAPAARALPQFQVEVLIFTHRDFDPNEEQFSLEQRRTPAGAEPLRETTVFDDPSFAPAGNAAQPETAAPPENEFSFRLLRPEELQLVSQYRVLSRLQAYHPLVHGGWVQLGLPDNETLPIDLGVFGVTNPTGTIRLSLTRFLHVKLDLSYVDAQPPRAAAFAPQPDALAELPVAPRYHLSAERTMRSGELHYFDHPAFGVLIKVTPIKPDSKTAGGTRPAA